MPEYSFERPNGEQVTLFYHMSEAPEAGSVVDIDGEPCVRTFSRVQTMCKPEVAFVSHQLARHHPDAPGTDDKGRPVFTNKQEIQSFCDKTNDNENPEGGIQL